MNRWTRHSAHPVGSRRTARKNAGRRERHRALRVAIAAVHEILVASVTDLAVARQAVHGDARDEMAGIERAIQNAVDRLAEHIDHNSQHATPGGVAT